MEVGRVVRQYLVIFQCRGVLPILILVWQRPTALAVGSGGVVCTFFSRPSFLFLSPYLWETARYSLKILSQRTVKPKTTNQPL